MQHKEALAALRQKIDAIDGQIIPLFEERMALSEQIAKVKTDGNLAITDTAREQAVVAAAVARAQSPAAEGDVAALMGTLMALSKLRQARQLMQANPVAFPPAKAAPKGAFTVAFQGVAGAWSQQGAERLFAGASTLPCDYFEDVFEAVKAGQAAFGVLPIENSLTGAIGEVYDLLRTHNCYITGQTWLPIHHCLIGVPGGALADVREVFSHPEGFAQCGRFLKNRNWELTDCRNTAYAAQKTAALGDTRYAAIGSRRAAEVHGLTVLAPDIMDNTGNRTRFIAIAAAPMYTEKSDTISVTFSTAHKSGALCAVLQSFMLAGINLSRIESRPVSAERYRFFADLQANILDKDTADALARAATHCSYFEVLGCYETRQDDAL